MPTAPPAVGRSRTATWCRGREPAEPEPLPKPKPWEAKPLNEEQIRDNPSVIPLGQRPDVILRFAEGKDLLLSGLLDKADAIAEHAIVVDAHLGSGDVLLFANRPIYRGETIGDYPLVFNAIINFGHLQAASPEPRKLAASPAPAPP